MERLTWVNNLGRFELSMGEDERVEVVKVNELEHPTETISTKAVDKPGQRVRDTDKITVNKLKKFLGSWLEMVKKGCVDRSVYEYRRGVCEGVTGVNEPCPKLKLGSDEKTYFCGGCGCGERDHAALFIKGVAVEDDKSPRLWMPDPQCPLQAIRPSSGSGSRKALGGRSRMVAALGRAAVKELKGAGKTKAEAKKLTRKVIKG